MAKVYFIGAGAGDKDLLTIKGLKALKRCDVVIYAGSLINKDILTYAKKDAEIYDSKSMTLTEIIKVIEEAIKENKNVARMHTGDPSLYGAILEQTEELKKKNIEFEIIPGVTALFAAAAKLNISLTAPNSSQTITISRIEGKTKLPDNEKLTKLLCHGGTFCFYLSADKIHSIVEEFLKAGYKEDTPIAVCYKVSWPDEKIIKGTLKDIIHKTAEIKKHAVVIVGDVLNMKPKEYSKLYDEKFSHTFR
ncbi:precorrin-4 C(11)-methyltransferase [Hippea jasoniae]|uniref:precorrin-4 C(11)-methyltransferase n=1 Tax=Hippea jasoniae TaxID=944479 RepID=UPI00054F8B3E|nr:precorrin-4 C(11)-methyltransferase [Hippea jasoniae]